MVSIKFNGKQPTLVAMKEMRTFMAGIKKHGNMHSRNRYFVYEGSVLKSAGPNKTTVSKYMKTGRTIFSIKK